MKEDLEAVERFIAEELEQRQSGGEDCPRCHGEGSAWIGVDGDPGGYYDYLITCPICKGEGRSPTITSAESALAALRRVRVRVERVQEECSIPTFGMARKILAILNDQEKRV